MTKLNTLIVAIESDKILPVKEKEVLISKIKNENFETLIQYCPGRFFKGTMDICDAMSQILNMPRQIHDNEVCKACWANALTQILKKEAKFK